jgi:hypothetical protein
MRLNVSVPATFVGMRAGNAGLVSLPSSPEPLAPQQ